MTTGKGKPAVKRAIEAAKPATPSVPQTPPEPANFTPPQYLRDRFAFRDTGLWKKGDDDGKGGLWLAAPFTILAETRSSDGAGWGLLIAWRDRDGVKHEEVFPRSMFIGECGELRQRLADGGLSLNGSAPARQAFAEFLNIASTPMRAWSVSRVGWHEFEGRRVFVLGPRTFGQVGGRVVLQSPDGEPSPFQSGGTLAGWRETVSRLCNGNSRLLFAASMAFAAPLLGLIGEDGGGFNYRGSSRIGKTTALRVAVSVMGGSPSEGASGAIRQWRATGNALEAVALGHSDCLIGLDEMAQVDPREAGELAYLLANGSGKSRAGRNGLARPTARWRVLFLSTGEISLADINAEAGRATKAGQEVRLVDLSGDAGAGMGLFEDIHNELSAGDFADLLKHNTRHQYGTALPAFLEALTARLGASPGDFIDQLRDRVAALVCAWLEAFPGAGGQVRSVARRFAIVAVAGEMASEWLITEWQKGAASGAAQACFRSWLTERGTTGAREDQQAVTQLRAFILQHGESRFVEWKERTPNDASQVDESDSQPLQQKFRTMQAAGWRRWEALDGGLMGWRYYPNVRRVCRGHEGPASARCFQAPRGAWVHHPPTN